MRQILACVLLATAALPSLAKAYYLEVRGTDTVVPIRYADADDPPAGTVDVIYRVNETGFPAGAVGFGAAIDAAFASWTAADCAVLSFAPGAPSDSTNRAHWEADAGEIYVLVYFTDSAEEWSGPSVGHFYFAHDGTGTLIGATVVLNSRDHRWATDGSADSLDVQGVVTALIGRSLGITSAMEMNATFPRYAPGDQSKQMLGADDLAAIQFLYPSDDMTCGIPMAPEAECDGIMLPGEDACPPRPMTMPGDGGTITPRRDAGTLFVDGGALPGADAGAASADGGGPAGGGDGCSCRVGASGRQSAPLFIALIVGGLFAVRRRRSI